MSLNGTIEPKQVVKGNINSYVSVKEIINYCEAVTDIANKAAEEANEAAEAANEAVSKAGKTYFYTVGSQYGEEVNAYITEILNGKAATLIYRDSSEGATNVCPLSPVAITTTSMILTGKYYSGEEIIDEVKWQKQIDVKLKLLYTYSGGSYAVSSVDRELSVVYLPHDPIKVSEAENIVVKGIASGLSPIIDDVSPIEHDLTVKVVSDSITDFSKISVKCAESITSSNVQTVIPSANGKVTGLKSISPKMLLWASNPIYKGDTLGTLYFNTTAPTADLDAYLSLLPYDNNGYVTLVTCNNSKQIFAANLSIISGGSISGYSLGCGETASSSYISVEVWYSTKEFYISWAEAKKTGWQIDESTFLKDSVVTDVGTAFYQIDDKPVIMKDKIIVGVEYNRDISKVIAEMENYSPTAKVEQTENGAVITITDKNGTTTATVESGDQVNNNTTAYIYDTDDDETIKSKLGDFLFKRYNGEDVSLIYAIKSYSLSLCELTVPQFYMGSFKVLGTFVSKLIDNAWSEYQSILYEGSYVLSDNDCTITSVTKDTTQKGYMTMDYTSLATTKYVDDLFATNIDALETLIDESGVLE